MQKTNSLPRNSSHNSIIFNLLLWLCSFAILLFSFSQNNTPEKIDYIYTACFLATIIIPATLNLYIWIPYFLQKEKYVVFSLLFIITILLFSQINHWFFDSLIDDIFPDYYFISYHSNTKLITIFSIFLIASMLIRLSEDWFYLNTSENEKLKLENQQIHRQLNSLRSQINPHFLFNSLNVIYSLALNQKKETTQAIVQLSDILRYVIYDSNTPTVSLKDEITLLQNYIDFQKFRHPESAQINFDTIIENDTFKIYPMLLLPLVENSFKHGIEARIEKTFIKIKLTNTKGKLHFLIENTYDKANSKQESNHSGVGLKNIRKNLELVYPNKHLFKISKTNKTFTVSLKIDNNEN